MLEIKPIMNNIMNYPDKYSMTPKQAVFFAKKYCDENVYCGMKMENRLVTFPQTKTILQGVNVPGVKLDDIQAILNMRDAWRYILNNPRAPLDFEFVLKLNEFIARNEALEWGKIRTGDVFISGADYKPPIPNEGKALKDFEKIMGTKDTNTAKALTLFTWLTRSQLFWDGNKRTALTAANKLMFDTGAGMLTIKDKNMEEFNEKLLDYYNTGLEKPLKDFLYQNALNGLTLT